MLRRWSTVAAVTALLALTVSPAFAGRGGTDRPFKGSFVGEAEFGFDVSCVPYNGGIMTRAVSTGKASHMGQVQSTVTHCPVVGGHKNGIMTIVADDGDELHVTYTDDTGTTSFPITVDGGTGKFAGASGDATLSYAVEQVFIPGCTPAGSFACFDLTVPWAFSATIKGTLSY